MSLSLPHCKEIWNSGTKESWKRWKGKNKPLTKNIRSFVRAKLTLAKDKILPKQENQNWDRLFYPTGGKLQSFPFLKHVYVRNALIGLATKVAYDFSEGRSRPSNHYKRFIIRSSLTRYLSHCNRSCDHLLRHPAKGPLINQHQDRLGSSSRSTFQKTKWEGFAFPSQSPHLAPGFALLPPFPAGRTWSSWEVASATFQRSKFFCNP